jgi:hypothetical protein
MATFELNTRTVVKMSEMLVKGNSKWVPKAKSSEDLIQSQELNSELLRLAAEKKKREESTIPKFSFPSTAEMAPKDMLIALTTETSNYDPRVKIGPSIELPCQGNAKKTFSFSQSKTLHSPHLEMYRRMYIFGLTDACKEAARVIRSNGSREGMINRLQTSLTKTFKYKNMPDMNQPHPHLFCDLTKYEFSQFAITHPCFDNINPDADAGLPYAFYLGGINNSTLPKFDEMTHLPINYREKGAKLLTNPMPIRDHAVAWATKIFKMAYNAQDCNDLLKQFRLLINAYPELNTYLIKRKDEKNPREEYLTKCRPYGVQPSALKLFFKWAVHPIETTLVPFFKNPHSCSAYHFSCFYGGGDQVLEWITYHYKIAAKTPEKWYFAGICYGDDQKWVFMKGGKIYVTGPDIRAMDMSTSSDMVAYSTLWATVILGENHDTNTFGVILCMYMLLRHFLHIGGPFVVIKNNSVMSGGVLTTIMNIFSSSMVQMKIEAETVKAKDTQFETLLIRVLTMIKTDMNYNFKDLDSKGLPYLESFNDLNHLTESGLGVSFLGQKFRRVKNNWVCVPKNVNAFGASLVHPNNFNKPDKNTVERILGVFLSGGWSDPKFNAFLREAFLASTKSNIIEKVKASDFLMPEQGLHDINEVIDVYLNTTINLSILKQGILPSDDFMLDFYTLDKESFKKKWETKQINEDEYSGQTNKFVDSLFEDDAINLPSTKASNKPKYVEPEPHTSKNEIDEDEINLPTIIRTKIDEINNKITKINQHMIAENVNINQYGAWLPKSSSNSSSSNSSSSDAPKLKLVPTTELVYSMRTAGHGNALTDIQKKQKKNDKDYVVQMKEQNKAILQHYADEFKRNKNVEDMNADELEDLKNEIIQTELENEDIEIQEQLKRLNLTVRDDFSDDEEDDIQVVFHNEDKEDYIDPFEIKDEGNIAAHHKHHNNH